MIPGFSQIDFQTENTRMPGLSVENMRFLPINFHSGLFCASHKARKANCKFMF